MNRLCLGIVRLSDWKVQHGLPPSGMTLARRETQGHHAERDDYELGRIPRLLNEDQYV